MSNRVKSFIWGGASAAAALAAGLYLAIGSEGVASYLGAVVFAVLVFSMVSCLILKNNFVRDMMGEIFDWGFVAAPNLITTFDLDGIIWLLTVKLLFCILGIILFALCGILAITLGLFVSVFVYPFALYKSFKKPCEE